MGGCLSLASHEELRQVLGLLVCYGPSEVRWVEGRSLGLAALAVRLLVAVRRLLNLLGCLLGLRELDVLDSLLCRVRLTIL